MHNSIHASVLAEVEALDESEPLDVRFERERVYLKPRAVPYIDGDQKTR